MARVRICILLQMLASIVFLIFFPHTVGKTHTVKCQAHYPYPPLHMYHQPGDLIIGVIASQTLTISDSATFHEKPQPTSFEELT